MNYEEKYNDLLSRIKRMADAQPDVTRVAIESLFPELKESEDERIRKSIIEFFKNFSKNGTWKAIPDVTKWIDWLEKQGEQKPNPCENCGIATNNCQNFLCAIRDGEQKPVDKVESKFKVGDWVVCVSAPKCTAFKTGDVVQISNKETLKLFLMFEDCFRLWDITKDAKDGDVLYDGNNACLFRKKMEDDDAIWVDTYCGINSDGMFNVNDEDECWCLACDCVPATKEQRDTLMKAMIDAGYTFDFEKKELKKIEQKPTWSEEERRIIDRVCVVLRAYANGGLPEILPSEILEYADKLQLLQPQPNQEWNEEDEIIWGMFIEMADSEPDENFYGATKERCSSWLKSLKDRVQPQPKQEWSEEDWNYIADLISYFNGSSLQHDTPDVISWLKSLRPQNRWKPSDEQMEALAWALSLAKNCGEENAFELRTVYEQLKKIREE